MFRFGLPKQKPSNTIDDINLISISAQNASILDLLGKLCRKYPQLSLFKKNVCYSLDENRGVRLSHPLLQLEPKTDYFRYHVIDDEHPLGAGVKGQVFPLIGLLKIPKDENSEVIFKKNSKNDRVVKISKYEMSLINEQKIGAKIVHGKKIITMHQGFFNGRVCYDMFCYVSRRYKGKLLSTILVEDIDRPFLTKEKIFSMSMLILKRVAEFQNLNIVHGDLKPENIIINLLSDDLHIIDFDSQQVNEEYKGLKTYGFGSPAVFQTHSSIKLEAKFQHDIFSVAIILFCLYLKKDDASITQLHIEMRGSEEGWINSLALYRKKLLSFLDQERDEWRIELNEVTKIKIYNLLVSCLLPELVATFSKPAPTIDELIHQFEEVQMQDSSLLDENLIKKSKQQQEIYKLIIKLALYIENRQEIDGGKGYKGCGFIKCHYFGAYQGQLKIQAAERLIGYLEQGNSLQRSMELITHPTLRAILAAGELGDICMLENKYPFVSNQYFNELRRAYR